MKKPIANYYIACNIRLTSGNKVTEVFLDGRHKTIAVTICNPNERYPRELGQLSTTKVVTICDPNEYYSYELDKLSTEDQTVILKAIAHHIGSDRLKLYHS